MTNLMKRPLFSGRQLLYLRASYVSLRHFASTRSALSPRHNANRTQKFNYINSVQVSRNVSANFLITWQNKGYT